MVGSGALFGDFMEKTKRVFIFQEHWSASKAQFQAHFESSSFLGSHPHSFQIIKIKIKIKINTKFSTSIDTIGVAQLDVAGPVFSNFSIMIVSMICVIYRNLQPKYWLYVFIDLTIFIFNVSTNGIYFVLIFLHFQLLLFASTNLLACSIIKW